MKVTLAQINTTVGDLAGNVDLCLQAIEQGKRDGSDMVVLPEMAIAGYPPRDILYDPSFTTAVIEATHDLAMRADGPAAIVGSLAQGPDQLPVHPDLRNCAYLIRNQRVEIISEKRLLPSYDVFHETRWFSPGDTHPPVEVADTHIGALVCEDMWDEGYTIHPAHDLLDAGAELLVDISASPYRTGVMHERLHHARRHRCPLIYVNQCGATDELIFDGRSFVLNSEGDLIAQLPAFEECIQTVELGSSPLPDIEENPIDLLFHALVYGVQEFCNKNHVNHIWMGLSGGIDSSLVAAIAAKALGASNVTGVAIPSRYSDPRSTSCAKELADNLGINFITHPLEDLHTSAEACLGSLLDHGIAAENVQARLRMLILMAYVNSRGGILLNTSNKTELTVGYGTLYGDLAGTLSPLGDVTKPEVYAMAHWLQAQKPVFPGFILERPPSAELKPNQVDPFDYPVISPQLEQLISANRSSGAIRRAEHKRWHMGIILKVSPKAFGTGRLIPVTRR